MKIKSKVNYNTRLIPELTEATMMSMRFPKATTKSHMACTTDFIVAGALRKFNLIFLIPLFIK